MNTINIDNAYQAWSKASEQASELLIGIRAGISSSHDWEQDALAYGITRRELESTRQSLEQAAKHAKDIGEGFELMLNELEQCSLAPLEGVALCIVLEQELEQLLAVLQEKPIADGYASMQSKSMAKNLKGMLATLAGMLGIRKKAKQGWQIAKTTAKELHKEQRRKIGESRFYHHSHKASQGA